MSCHNLGDVLLITKEEVEAMLGAVLIPEEVIDAKIASEREARDLSENIIKTALNEEVSTRTQAVAILEDKISDEAKIRSREDAALRMEIKTEAAKRKQADTEFIKMLASFVSFEEETYPNAYGIKLKGLPIALLTIHNTDKSLHVGDTIATVDEKFFPKRAVDFWMDVEQVDPDNNGSKTCWLHCRLDNHGNVNVINMFDWVGATSATDEYTVPYLTEIKE